MATTAGGPGRGAALVEETRADELIVVSDVYEHAERLRSFELIAEAADLARKG